MGKKQLGTTREPVIYCDHSDTYCAYASGEGVHVLKLSCVAWKVISNAR